MTGRIGLFGGTFDPIHLGHLIIASLAADELGLDRVLFLPAQTPPHKLDDTITPPADRLAMLHLAVDGDDRFHISDADLGSGAPSYTSELVARLAKSMPDNRLFFIAGADSLRDFPTWHQPTIILRYVDLAILSRPGVEITERMLDAVPGLRDQVSFFPSPLIDISSTAIRERARRGASIRYLVPHDVERFITDRGLYR